MPTANSLRLGTWFAVPLPTGGYALGLIARGPRGRAPKAIFCYFFGPRIQKLECLQAPISRRPKDRIYFARTNDRAFKERRWFVLGHLKDFDKGKWTMPPYRSAPVGGGPAHKRRRYLRTYDDDLRQCISEKLALVSRLQDYPRDISFGHIAVEAILDRILDGTYEEH